MREFCLILIFKESENYAAENKFLVRIYTSNLNHICLTSLTRAKPKEKWNFPLYIYTMRKLSDLYSGIFQTQSSGCASGVNYFRNFTKLKNLNF